MSAYNAMNAPDLVKRWKAVVNDNVMMGRDAALLKSFLLQTSSVQILLGMYQYKGNRTISIPQFLRSAEVWLEPDEVAAEIHLATLISGTTPPEFYIWQDFVDEETAYAFQETARCLASLKEWADGVLS